MLFATYHAKRQTYLGGLGSGNFTLWLCSQPHCASVLNRQVPAFAVQREKLGSSQIAASQRQAVARMIDYFDAGSRIKLKPTNPNSTAVTKA
jgi:hypothetical protein